MGLKPGTSTRLAAGARLGPYEIVTLIGSGRMGEVYSARDTRLDRLVAVKTLGTGAVRVLSEASLGRFDASWNSDGVIVFSPALGTL